MTDAQRDLVRSLRSLPLLVRAVVRDVDVAAAGRAAPGEWPITTVVAHLADVDDLMVARMRRILTEPNPVIADYDPEGAAERGGFASRSLPEALERLEAARARYVAVLAGLAPRDWFRPVTHESDGVFTVESFTARIVHHDLAHLEQICRLLDRGAAFHHGDRPPYTGAVQRQRGNDRIGAREELGHEEVDPAPGR